MGDDNMVMDKNQISECYDLVVLGGGAAGLMCARQAALRGSKVLLLERSDEIGAKIRISGGGRCNFTNRTVEARNYLSENPDFCRSALARYKPQRFVEWMESEGIRYHEKTLGQLFCDGSAEQIVELFRRELRRLGVQLRVSVNVNHVQIENAAEQLSTFRVDTTGNSYRARYCVVATGGLSIPKMGATDAGHRLARQFGMRVVEPRPALVPLLVEPRRREHFASLSGVSLLAVARCGTIRFREHVLFTHRGLSGPAILQISSYWRPGHSIHLDLLPDTEIGTILNTPELQNMELKNVLALHLPRRLAETWCELEFPTKPLKQINAAQRERIEKLLHDWEIAVTGTEGFAKAEVTAGGVDTRDLSSKTMESKTQPGLYFIGEAVDVTGWLGGYNFQWAWASAVAAAEAIAERVNSTA